MEAFFKIYIAVWALACGLALLLYWRRRDSFAISRRPYWQFLTEPWKLATFIAATVLITLVAPYTGDPTWDYADGFFMSVFCYATAPWVVATLYFAARRRAGLDEAYVAICTWLFSASWSYDIYLVWRDSEYPMTWLPNLFASSLIYLCAGLFWNLEHRPGRGVIFAFMDGSWPARSAGGASAWRLALYGTILALPAIVAVLMYLI